ncbi:MAG: 50S ribosomal protein L19 [Alphaproteobacteria bacterium]|nr:50S ribosomal protein L19 [Alphaproteobacteria bacterium]
MDKLNKKINFKKIIESTYEKKLLPNISIGNFVKLGLMVQDGKKNRIQFFEGIIIAITNEGLNKTITVRKKIQGIGVEKTLLLHSPLLISIEIKKYSQVRRAKLYFLRNLSDKASRLKRKII